MDRTKVLLVVDVFSNECCTGMLVLKNLWELGYVVKVWDINCMDAPSWDFFDVCIVWTNSTFGLSIINSPRKVLYYLEDSDYYAGRRPGGGIKERMVGFDYVFTMNRLSGFEDFWLPMGGDESVFHPVESQIMEGGVLFLGTCRDDSRREFAKELGVALSRQGVALAVCGNGWSGFPNWGGRAFYFKDLNNILNQFRIVVNLHVGLESPSDKVHVITCSGGPLLINDDKSAFKECYPLAPTWRDVPELVGLCEKYLADEPERSRLAGEMRNACLERFTYKKGLQELLRRVGL